MNDPAPNSPAPPPALKPPPRTWMQRLRRAVVVYVVVPYVAILVLMTVFQRSLMYHQSRDDRLTAASFDAGDGRLEDIRIETYDGLTLNGWLLHSAEPTRDPGDRYVVVSFPGNAGNRGDRVYDCVEFAQEGFDVVLVDYRGYGDNPGSPNETGLIEDAWSIWSYLTTERKIAPERIILFGESLGGGVAVQLAARACREGHSPAGLVVSSTFSSMTAAAQSNYPYIPVKLLLFDRFSSDEHIGDVDSPLVVLHGTADSIVPFELGRALFETAPEHSRSGVPKRFIELHGNDHNNVSRSVLAEQLSALTAQLD